MKCDIASFLLIVAGTLIISGIFLTSVSNNKLQNNLNEKVDSLSQEVKQLRHEMDNINNDLLNMF